MSAVHHHPNWAAIKATLVQADPKSSPSVYAPKKAMKAGTLIAHGDIMAEILKTIEYNAIQYTKEPSFSMMRRIKLANAITLAAADLGLKDDETSDVDLKENKKLAEAEKRLKKISGLTLQDYQTCLKLAKMLVVDFFVKKGQVDEESESQDPAVIVNHSMRKRDIENWMKELTEESLSQAYDALGIKQGDAVQFTEEDLAAFGINKSQVTADPATISCYAFAFLTVREQRAKNIIFKNKQLQEDRLGQLKEWGYRTVEAPQEGDFAVYLDKDGKVTHIGVVTESGKISSKLGIRSPVAHLHNVFDIPPGYGSKVIFMRKSNANLFAKTPGDS